MFRVSAEAARAPAFLFWFYFFPLLLPPHYLTPPFCFIAPHFLSTLFISLPSNPSVHTLSLSLHPFGGTVLLIMPVIGVTHTFPVCLDQIKNIVSILPTWPLLAELNGLCSVCSKLKASQFISPCLRLTGVSYSWRNTAQLGEEENERDFPLPQVTLVQGCTQLLWVGVREREREVKNGTARRSSDVVGFIIQLVTCVFRDRIGFRVVLAVSCTIYCQATSE